MVSAPLADFAEITHLIVSARLRTVQAVNSTGRFSVFKDSFVVEFLGLP